MGKGQSSVEYIFVVALSLMLIVPASFLFLNYAGETEDSVVAAQINTVGNEIISKVEEMYVIGNNSWMTLEVTMPESFQQATIYGEKELVIDYYIRSGYTQAVFFSNVLFVNSTDFDCASEPCNISLAPGINNIRITSLGDKVSVVRT